MSYEPRILVWDIERCAMIARTYDRWNTNIRPQATIRDERTVSFASRWLGEKKSKTVYFSEWGDGRETMLRELHDRLTEADFAVGWNSKRFDTRAINRDFFLAGMGEPAPYTDLDLMVAVKRKMFFTSNSLKNVTRELGIEGKVEVHDLDALTEAAMEGDAKSQRLHRVYNKRDVDVLADELWPRLEPWIPASMHPNRAIGTVGEVCPRCGSEKLERRGLKYTATGVYQQYKCENGHWPRGTRRLDTSDLRA
jgi:hypothetical protein